MIGAKNSDPNHVAGGLTFLGLQGMMDPPRPEAIAAVAKCQSAGVSLTSLLLRKILLVMEVPLPN
jgi:magnesium-transporting ATPase (P-type)